MRWALLWIASLLRIAAALYSDEAGVLDYHLPLLGLPGNSTTFFHQPVPGSKASLVYTLSDKNVLGAVNPKDGSIVWRQQLGSPGVNARRHLRTTDGQDALLTSFNASVYAFSASNGRLLWQTYHHDDYAASIITLVDSQAKANGGALVLWEGKQNTLQKLEAETGAVQWTQEDPSSGHAPLGVVSTPSALYYVSLAKAMLKGHKITVTTFDPISGKNLDHYTLAAESEVSSPADILFVGSCGPRALLVWTDTSKRVVKANVLGSKQIASLDVSIAAEPILQLAVHSSPSHSKAADFLIESRNADSHWASTFQIDVKNEVKKATVSKAYELPRLNDLGTFSSSTVDGQTFFVRVNSEIQLFSSASHGILARWPIGVGQHVSFLRSAWRPVQASSEVVARPDSTYAVRSIVLQDTGDWVLVRNGDIGWSRPEQLAGIKKAAWVGLALGTEQTVAGDYDTLPTKRTGFLHRVQTHIATLSALPRHIPSLSMRLRAWMEALVGGESTTAAKGHAFGFDKPVLAELENGDVVSIDPSRPERVTRVDKSKSLEIDQAASPCVTNSQESSVRQLEFTTDETGISGKAANGNIWRFAFRNGHRLRDIKVMPCGQSTASIGKVLGDRTVLYKYLNENAVLIMTASQGQRSLSVFLLDATTGTVLVSSHLSNVDLSRPVTSTLSENWFAYSFTSDASQETLSRGHQLVMVELYESELPNDRGPTGSIVNQSSLVAPFATPGSLKPHAISQTFQIPEEVSKMTVTQTKQGITSRQLLLTLENTNGVVGIPHQVLDPRRPVGKAPTNQQLEEGLMQYAPTIDFDPKWFLTRNLEVLGINNVISSPSDMESTSLVFAYGLDVFGTRISPSFAFDILGPSFNKIQLTITVAALTLGVFVVAPLINRKQTNALWQSS